MSRMARLVRGTALLGTALLAGACAQVQPSRFYTLATTGVEAPPVAKQDKQLLIGLGPVRLPEYLNRPDLVTRSGQTQMRLSEIDKWAEPLEPLVVRTMAEDLLILSGAKDVIPVPQRRDVDLDRVVEVDMARFDADETGQVVLDARWRVYGRNGERLLTSSRSTISEQGAPPPDYNAVVAAMSRALAQLSREIAAAIRGDTPPVPKRQGRISTSATPLEIDRAVAGADV